MSAESLEEKFVAIIRRFVTLIEVMSLADIAAYFWRSIVIDNLQCGNRQQQLPV